MASWARESIERALESFDAEERRQATAELARTPLAEALPLLYRALGDEDWRVRKEATIAARAFGPAGPLVDALVETRAGQARVNLNKALDNMESARKEVRAAMTDVAIEDGANLSQLARALGVSRQLVSRLALESRGHLPQRATTRTRNSPTTGSSGRVRR